MYRVFRKRDGDTSVSEPEGFFGGDWVAFWIGAVLRLGEGDSDDEGSES